MKVRKKFNIISVIIIKQETQDERRTW